MIPKICYYICFCTTLMEVIYIQEKFYDVLFINVLLISVINVMKNNQREK